MTHDGYFGTPSGPQFLPPTQAPVPTPPTPATPAPPPAMPGLILPPPGARHHGGDPPTASGAPEVERGRGARVVVLAVVLAGLVGGGTGVAGGYFAAGGPSSVQALPRADAPPRAASSGTGGSGGVADAATAVLPSVVSVQVTGAGRTGTGSGFVIDDRGHVLTNSHVVAGARQVRLVLAGGRSVAATVVGTDPSTDLAVVRATDTAGLRPVTLGRSAQLRVGDQVLAIGSPLGLSGTVTAGIVSAVDRMANLGDTDRRQTAIQTDASINPGNSGGPLVNAAGQVVGVNTAIATLGSSRSGNIGIGFAIPMDRAAGVAEQLIARR